METDDFSEKYHITLLKRAQGKASHNFVEKKIISSFPEIEEKDNNLVLNFYYSDILDFQNLLIKDDPYYSEEDFNNIVSIVEKQFIQAFSIEILDSLENKYRRSLDCVNLYFKFKGLIEFYNTSRICIYYINLKSLRKIKEDNFWHGKGNI